MISKELSMLKNFFTFFYLNPFIFALIYTNPLKKRLKDIVDIFHVTLHFFALCAIHNSAL